MLVNDSEIFWMKNKIKQNKKLQYSCKQYENLSEDKKQRLNEYRKNYSTCKKLKTD